MAAESSDPRTTPACPPPRDLVLPRPPLHGHPLGRYQAGRPEGPRARPAREHREPTPEEGIAGRVRGDRGARLPQRRRRRDRLRPPQRGPPLDHRGGWVRDGRRRHRRAAREGRLGDGAHEQAPEGEVPVEPPP
ncbi:hypothetical protein THAOC_33333, partial [Thalassiosira oceanica]